MATIETIPALVLPGREMQFRFTPTDGGNLVKVWCTAAPLGSKLRAQLDQQQTERVLVIAESDITKRPSHTFEKGGVYALQVEEFQKGAENYGGRYRGDPDGFRTETRLANTPANIHVASLLEAEIGVAPDVAKLQVYVSDDAIVATRPATHGFSSPSIERPATDRARAAADSDSVVAALAVLGDSSSFGAIGDLRTAINNWIDQFNGHISDARFHANPDSNNTIARAFQNPYNLKSIAVTLAECVKRFTGHVENIDTAPDATSQEPGSADYHEDSGNNVVDWGSTLLARGGNTIGACQVLFADLHRCYVSHQTSNVHLTDDNDWNLDALADLGALHSAFLAELAALAPEAPDNEHEALALLVSGAGFRRAV